MAGPNESLSFSGTYRAVGREVAGVEISPEGIDTLMFLALLVTWDMEVSSCFNTKKGNPEPQSGRQWKFCTNMST